MPRRAKCYSPYRCSRPYYDWLPCISALLKAIKHLSRDKPRETFPITGHLSLKWRHDDPDGVSNHQPHDCLINCLLRRRLNKTSKLRVTGLCVGNSPVTGEYPAQRDSNAANVSIWWRHHGPYWVDNSDLGHDRRWQWRDWPLWQTHPLIVTHWSLGNIMLNI